MEKFANQDCLGYRKVLAETQVNCDGKMTKKAQLADEYTWLSYADIDRKVDAIARGLTTQGIKQSTRKLNQLNC